MAAKQVEGKPTVQYPYYRSSTAKVVSTVVKIKIMQAPPDEGSAAVERAPTPTKFFKRKQLFVEMDELRGKLSAYTQQEALFSCHFNFFVLPPLL